MVVMTFYESIMFHTVDMCHKTPTFIVLEPCLVLTDLQIKASRKCLHKFSYMVRFHLGPKCEFRTCLVESLKSWGIDKTVYYKQSLYNFRNYMKLTSRMGCFYCTTLLYVIYIELQLCFVFKIKIWFLVL